MKDNSIEAPLSYKIKGIFFFLLFYIIFLLYLRLIVGENTPLIYFINSLIFIIFILSSFKIKYGLYLFIFLIPLLNSSAGSEVMRQRYTILFLFFALFLGFIVNSISSYLADYPHLRGKTFIFNSAIMKLILVFTGIMFISCAITIFRYSNLYPFITNEYRNLLINVNGSGSTKAMVWTIRYFYNYFIGFLFLFLIFNVVKNTKDILYSIIAIISATMVSVGVVIYQYFVDPYLGNVKHWVDSGRYNATFTDPNALGGFTILLFPVFLGMILYFKKWYMKLIFFFLFLIFLILLFFSGSRSAFVGVFLAITVFVVLFIIRGFKYLRRRMFAWPKKRKVLIWAIIIFIISCLILTIFYLFSFQEELLSRSSLIDRTVKSFKTGMHYYSKYGLMEGLKSVSNFRNVYWGQAVEMFKDYPITGVGQGSYILQLPNYLLAERAGIAQVDYSGNYYLQILSELGLPGIILIITIFFMFANRGFRYFLARRRSKKFEKKDWIMISLFIAFISMLVGQIFGPHTNFEEIQLAFWLIIGLMITFIKIEQKNDPDNIQILTISNRFRFDRREKISLAVILVVFISVFIFNSITTLSINNNQNLYDRKGNYVGWQNDYGFYKMEQIGDETIAWVAGDASTVVEKKGNTLIIPLKDSYPEVPDGKLGLKIFVNNLLAQRAVLDYNKWKYVEIDVPASAKEHFTLTLVFDRSWSPKELGLSNDTRDLGAQMREFIFID